jgi:hypothetical protein
MPEQLLSYEDFLDLKREHMYEELKRVRPDLAVGNSRARKDELCALYAQALSQTYGDNKMEEKYVPVNPPMPAIEMQDGAVLGIPPEPPRKYMFKDGVERELTEKQAHLLRHAEQAFAQFCANPANKEAKRAFESNSWSLKTTGVLLNPQYFSTIREGRSWLRNARRAKAAQ